MKKNSNKMCLSKSTEQAFIEKVKKTLFECDNTVYRDTVDKIMDKTGETAAEIASALIGIIFSTDGLSESKKTEKTVKKEVSSKAKNTKKAVQTSQKKESKKKAPAEQKVKASPISKKNDTPTNQSQLVITGGKNKNFTHKDIVGALLANTDITAADISKIRINEKQTVVSVSSRHVEGILNAMNAPKGKIKGIPVKVHIPKERKKANKNALES